MLKLIEALWATVPLVPYTEDDSETTEVCGPPTLPSVLSAESAYEMAMAAIAEGRHEEAKTYMQYYNAKTRGL
jgi:hypothetical protein